MPKMEFHGPVRFRPESIRETFVLEHAVIEGASEDEYAVDIEYPHADSSIWPTVYMRNVTLCGRWWKPLRLVNCWNARLIDVTVAWHALGGELDHPVAEIGIDCYNSMDVHVIRPMINGYKVGVRSRDLDWGGHAEGLHVEGGYIMNVDVGVRLEGFGSGGGPTPHAYIGGGIHIMHHVAGVEATRYRGVQVMGANLYPSVTAVWPFGISLTECMEVRLGNVHWMNKSPAAPKNGAAILLDRCDDVTLDGNVVGEGFAGSYVILPECGPNIGADNVWRAQEFDMRRKR
jgi:hypothetical protein